MSELRKKTSRAFLWNAAGQYVVQLLSFLTAAVLGRLLDPSDFGMVGMILAVNAFLILFSNVGLASTIVQHDDLGRSDIAALWGGAIFLGVLVMVAMQLLSPAIAWFFKEPGLLVVAIAVAPTLLLTSINSIPVGVLQRDFRFSAIAINTVISGILAAGIAIYCAFEGFGYWALVLQMFVRSGIVLSLNTFSSRIALVPRLDFSLYRRLIGYSGNLSLFQFINYFHRNLDSILIGRILGTVSLGFYTRSTLLLRTFNTAFGGVIAPVLHTALAKKKHDVDAMRRAYGEVLRVTLWLSAPIMGVLAGLAPLVIRLVWGEGWDLSVTPFFWLALAAMHQSVFATFGAVFMARDRTRALLVCGCITTILFGIAIASGVSFGLDSVARNYSIMSHFVFLPVILFIWVRLLEGGVIQLFCIILLPNLIGWVGLFLFQGGLSDYRLAGALDLLCLQSCSIYLWLGLVCYFYGRDLYPVLRSLCVK